MNKPVKLPEIRKEAFTKARETLGLSAKDLSGMACLSVRQIEQIENGDVSVDEVIEAAYDNDVDLEWDFQYDDCWTDRKGGYDVTYELGDESSWVEPDAPPEPTHKCTKCKWKGGKYDTATQYLREDNTVIENYFESDEDSHSTKDICPMCDSDVELTEEGKLQEERYKDLLAELDREVFDE